MADDKPIVRFCTMAEQVEGDCACPGVNGLTPHVRPAEPTFVAEQDCACAAPGQPRPSTAGRRVMAPSSTPAPTLTAWLHVTERCNLHCAYCYAARGQADMDQATGQAALESIFRAAARHGFRAVKLKYAGGEPSLNFSLVRALHLYAEALAGRHRLELGEVLLSNGIALAEATLLALRDMGIRLAVSLDGIGAVHDAQRGAGTFVGVADTLERALALGLRPHLSVTVTAQNVAGLREVVAYALERDLPFNLNFYREQVCPPQGPPLRAESDCLIAEVRAALALIAEHLPRQNIVSGLLDRASFGYPHVRPCGVGQSYVVVDPRGYIARCHMEMDRTVGHVRHDDPVLTIRTARDEWQNPEVDAKQECRDCTWRYVCAGGCPLLAYRLTGREQGPSPYCSVYRALLPDLVRLEGLRLMKWGPPVA
jgi:uncharacterized protein